MTVGQIIESAGISNVTQYKNFLIVLTFDSGEWAFDLYWIHGTDGTTSINTEELLTEHLSDGGFYGTPGEAIFEAILIAKEH